jgi:16S rRNA (uracil1498-N3)-methyltransferase
VLEVCDVAALRSALEANGKGGLRMILHPGSGPFPHALAGRSTGGSICIAVGPEGGFTGDEVAMAVDLGFEPVGLGASILRIETAAIAAAVLSVAILGAFGSSR